MAQQFPNLFSPLKVGTMTLRNRIASSGHGTWIREEHTNLPGDKLGWYWAAKAKGGIGLIITEGLGFHQKSCGANVFNQKDSVPQLKKAADLVHQFGAKIIVQGGNQGAQDFPRVIGLTTWSSSPLPSPRNWGMPHVMSADEVKELTDAWAFAAKISREAGYDGFEIYAGHGYMLQQYMSPFFNSRTDQYGGSLENRLRFPLEVIDAVRAAVGKDFTICLRISGDEFTEGGYTLDDMLTMVQILTKSGKIDFLDITASTYRSIQCMAETMYFPLNSFVYLGAEIKKVVKIPVMARGRIIDPAQAEEIIASGQADIVNMCRATIADPELPNKAREGRVEEIRKCLGCNEGCIKNASAMMPIRCSVNAEVTRENQPGWLQVQPAATRKKVVVIGGGPAGLEAARVLAMRGHKVSLYDRGSELGGQILIAAKAPGRDGFLELPRYFTHQMKLLGVDVHLGVEVTADMVKKMDADAVVVATGSFPFIPRIPGVNQKNVVETREVLMGKAQVGQNVVVVAGEQNMEALTVADFCAQQGKKVDVVTEEYAPGLHVDPPQKQTIFSRLYRNGVIFTPCHKVREITGNTVVISNIFTLQDRRIEGVDTVILGCGGQEDNALYYALKGQIKELYRVGDCNGVRRLPDATLEASRTARII
jgi:2,4-dienoyl-CoA reductase-like NADH-dependent reductase (Old Yellow Enzyme family)/thioredoxin reductase